MIKVLKIDHDQAGFTLVEVLIYLGLFSIVISGVIAASFAIFESSDRISTKNMVQQEGNFLMAKINWAMNSASSVTAAASPPSLTINRTSAPSTIIFNLDAGNNLQLSGTVLNNSNVKISNLAFTHTGGGSDPEAITASFTLETLTAGGAPYAQNFETTKYLRK